MTFNSFLAASEALVQLPVDAPERAFNSFLAASVGGFALLLYAWETFNSFLAASYN